MNKPDAIKPTAARTGMIRNMQQGHRPGAGTMTGLAKMLCVGAGLATISGCAAVGDYLAAEYEAGKARGSPQMVLARQVANARTHMSSSTNLVTMHGRYGGVMEDGCHRVSVYVVQHKSTTDYRVCNGTVLGINEVAPALPKHDRLDATRLSVARAAWAKGEPANVLTQGYLIEAAPVGPPDGQGCRMIEDRVVQGPQLIDLKQRKICP